MATLGEYLGTGASTTALLLHLNGSNADSSGNSNSGTDSNITYSLANGKFGQGAGMAATGYILFPTSTSLDRRSTTTLSCWVNLTDMPASGAAYHFIQRGVGAGFGMFTRVENVSGTSKIKTSVVIKTGVDTMYTVEGLTPSSDTWYNVVGVYDSANSLLHLYINGYYYGNVTTTTGNTMRLSGTASEKGVIIGAYDTTNGRLKGKIDELIIDDRAWSASEVKKYYTYAKGRFGII